MSSLIKKLITLFLLIFLFISIIIAVSISSVDIEFLKVIGILLNKLGFSGPKTWTKGEEQIVLKLRLPRALMAVTIGAMLGVAGVAAQGLFRNPTVDPYVIGISSSANFGVALVIALGISLFSIFTIPLVSFLFAMLGITIVYELSKTHYRLSINTLLLAGLAVSFFFSALTSFILYYSEDKSHFILTYLLGSLRGTTWLEFYVVFAIMVPSTILLFFYGRDLNLMVFGDDIAQSMGVNIEVSKKRILFLMVLLSSTAVAFCGVIGFIGLIIPHSMRLITGNNNRKLIPLSAIAGGLLLLWADILARTLVSPREIPVGIFTALLGGPFFLYLIMKRKKSGEFV